MSKHTVMQNFNYLEVGGDNSNLLKTVHPLMTHLPIIIRDRICQECNWSTPTFYRKIRYDKVGPSSISNAEKEKIMEIVYKELTAQAERFKPRR